MSNFRCLLKFVSILLGTLGAALLPLASVYAEAGVTYAEMGGLYAQAGVQRAQAGVPKQRQEGAKRVRLGCLSSLDMPDTQYIQSIAEPIFNRHGFELSIKQASAADIDHGIRAGEFDGDCGRGDYFSERYDGSLVRVDPAFRNETILVWGRRDKAEAQPDGLVVAYPRGWQFFEDIAREMGYSQWRELDNMEAMIKAAARGEIDAFITYYAAVEANMAELKKFGLVYHRDILSLPIHLHLSTKYQHLLPELAEAIVARKAESPYPDYDVKTFSKRGKRHIVFGCSMPPKYASFREVEAFYRRAFRRLGYEFTLVALPRAREVAEVLSGRLDGSCARGDLAPFNISRNLIQLPVSVVRSGAQLMTYKPDVKSISDIPTTGVVAYVRGTQSTNRYLEALANHETLGVTSVEIGVRMLAAKRIAYLVDNSVLLGMVVRELKSSVPLYRHSISETYSLYPYINRRHSQLVDPLVAQLNELLQRMPGKTLIYDPAFKGL